MGSFWNPVGIDLGACWDYLWIWCIVLAQFGIMMGSCCAKLGSFGDDVRINLV